MNPAAAGGAGRREYACAARNRLRMLLTALVPALTLALAAAVLPAAEKVAPPAPEFTHTDPADWIGSGPLKLADLRGSVVLVYVWNFGCRNCYRSFPWLRALEQKFEPRGLRVIGVHTPENDTETERDQVSAKVGEFMLTDPQMLDNNMSYWNALHNRYWPAFFLIDRQGRLRGRYIGETHEGDARAAEIETTLTSLLAEPAPPPEPPRKN